MARIKVAKAPLQADKSQRRRLYATLCYYYPQYTLEQASRLTSRDINLLIKTAVKIETKKMYDLTQIASAPHTEKGIGVKNLLEHYKRIISNG